ncbi:hypothetical protein NHQ30_007778 [Ciborinia camelliae]|nr:hypothetical protein NHQ30_007778 [Ciborinia camelliae]
MVAAKEGLKSKSMARVPMTSSHETDILAPLQLLPQTPQTPQTSISRHQSTAQKLASLLQEVASIMDTITGEKMMCGEELDGLEGDVLGGLTEMVLIMEEEVEGMIELADAVEEYVEELELAELDDWVADLAPLKNNARTVMGDSPWESQTQSFGMKGWRGNIGNIAPDDGKENVRVGLEDRVKRRISLSGLLEEIEEDVLEWKGVREISVSLNSDDYGSDERSESEVVIGAGISVPITNYKKEEVIQQTIISLPPRKDDDTDTNTKFRDSGLGLLSPAGVTRIPVMKESNVVVKSSPIGFKTGLGSTGIRRKKMVGKPKAQWV